MPRPQSVLDRKFVVHQVFGHSRKAVPDELIVSKHPNARALRHAYGLLVIFSLLDFVAADSLVNQWGIGIEANPLMYQAMRRAGSAYAMLLAKVAPLALLGVGLWLLVKHKQPLIARWTVVLWVLTAVQAIIALYAVAIAVSLDV